MKCISLVREKYTRSGKRLFSNTLFQKAHPKSGLYSGPKAEEDPTIYLKENSFYLIFYGC